MQSPEATPPASAPTVISAPVISAGYQEAAKAPSLAAARAAAPAAAASSSHEAPPPKYLAAMQKELAALRAETNELRIPFRTNQEHVQQAATLVRDVAASSARYGRAAHVALAAAT
eukprot:3655281-Alexandrium_andersonii.AAC.1